MEKANKKLVGAGGSSSSSFTTDLFGPKEPPRSASSSSQLFNSVFGPHSTGLRRDSTHSTGVRGSSSMQDSGNQYGNTTYGTSDNGSQRSREDISSKDKSSIYQNDKVEPCYFSSSIYYGGQDVYSSTSQTGSQHIFKKDGEDDDQDGNDSNSASRGNWWQGMAILEYLYKTNIPLNVKRDIKSKLSFAFLQDHFITDLASVSCISDLLA